MIRSLIIDDEKRSREVLDELIAKIEGLTVVGFAESVDEGLDKIIQLSPDLIFLDIEMPLKTGFDLVREMADIDNKPEIIFITAYDKYAIEAFKYAAFDYLLKPVGLDDLLSSIKRFKKKKLKSDFNNRINKLFAYLRNKERIKFNLRTGLLIINPEDLIYCEADGNYTHLILTDGKSEMVSFNLGLVEKELEGKGFFRLNRSVLVNLDHIIKIDTRNKTCEVKYDHSYVKFKISQEKIKELKSLL
ncbi:MAG: LytR/AlgR family response regulator transcription factor [Bacteroidales bacterium]